MSYSQVMAIAFYDDSAHERLDRVFGFMVNLRWAREHYFSELIRQSALLAARSPGIDFVLTDERGNFKFPGLLPDLYSLKVTLATFVPAWKKNILVQPGMRSVFNVNLNTLFSSIQLAYPPLENGSLMSESSSNGTHQGNGPTPLRGPAGFPAPGRGPRQSGAT